jgi:hypothetical protein
VRQALLSPLQQQGPGEPVGQPAATGTSLSRTASSEQMQPAGAASAGGTGASAHASTGS